MTDSDHALDAIASAAETLIPELTERLRRHGLGEIEVSVADLRLRVTESAARDPAPGSAVVAPGAPAPAPQPPAHAAEGTPAPAAIPVTSPGVGFFLYADGLGPGLHVAKGDALGHVEVLGVRHDVRAPRAGTVRHLVAESGEAVEYGQVVVDMEAAR
jgi:acetyl-CoA carboxylase biotin carboxyl carrier protein